jgi:DNA-binding NarL/FixJ family response regulator
VGVIGVYLLDDHEVVRRGLVALLEGTGEIEVIGESGSAQEAARRIPALRPDVAVLDARLDARLPDGSGIDVCREVRSADPGIQALILTSYQDDEALYDPNRQIGEQLFLAEKTVKNYVSSLLAKLGLERRTQAAILATKLLGEH